MNLRRIALLFLFATSVFVAGRASGSTLYGGAITGVAPFSTLYTVDQSTGGRTPIGSGGFSIGYTDLTSDWRPQSYRLWGVVQDGQSTLARIDPATGNRTVIGTM